jgi:hypothetical protein
VISIFGAASAYVLFQARYLIFGPQITLEATHPGRTNQPVVILRGHAHTIARLWLNDRQIFTDRAGNFEEALVLENGYTIATLAAEDRFGRRTTLTREFVYVPATFIK